VPEREGYSFKGWYKEGNQIKATTIVDTYEDHMLYAKWKGDNSIVSFDARGGTGITFTSKGVTQGEPYGELPQLGPPVGITYVFDGWYTKPNGQGTYISKDSCVEIIGDHTLYAHFVKPEILVKFDAKGGECGRSTDYVKYGEKYGTLPSASKEGCLFDGWEDSWGGKVTENSTVGIDGEHTLYARWISISIGDYVEYTPTTSMLTIGKEYTNYETDQYFYPSQYKGGWRIAGWNEYGEMILISATSVGEIWFNGSENAYNNYCEVLDFIGRGYANNGNGGRLNGTISEGLITNDTRIWTGVRTQLYQEEGKQPFYNPYGLYITRRAANGDIDDACLTYKAERQCFNTIYYYRADNNIDYVGGVQPLVVISHYEYIINEGKGTKTEPFKIAPIHTVR
jgi:uncharacterized repeat protein (TIGR02543 family)